MHAKFVSLMLLVLFISACSSNTETPVPSPVVPAGPTSELSALEATQTPQLVLNLITPTPQPTNPPPTETLTSTTSSGQPRPTTPPELGTSGADAALVAILQSCWHVSDPRQMNGSNAAHRDAFDCGRGPLTSLAKNYPAYALVHRVLAWGYYFKDNDTTKAQQEYATAAALYHQAGDKIGESQARMRLGLLIVAGNRSSGCSEFAAAGNLDPTNDQTIQYYNAYSCSKTTLTAPSGGGGAPPPPQLQVNLDQVRGKILYKSDRDGFENVYVMDPDGKNQKSVTSGVYAAAATWEAFSPDHSKVAVVQFEGGSRQYGYNNDIWVNPVGGAGRGFENPANDYDPVWSPNTLWDGSYYLAFVSNRADVTEEIWMMHTDGSATSRLTCHPGLQSKHPSWSPDSSKLVFGSSFPKGKFQIFVMDVSGIRTVGDHCEVGAAAINLSNSGANDYEPIWVK